MTDDDRILLAEAMNHPSWQAYINPNEHPEQVDLPDPENDANDDYQVLEWMRSLRGAGIEGNHWGWWGKFSDSLTLRCRDYQIGDYARAALEVLREDRE